MGEQLCGQSEWFTITQGQINQFADVTQDHQYLHVDRERAAKTPFGGTIAHGFLYLSLLPHLMLDELFAQLGEVTVLNYGVNHLRFIAPVLAESSVRLNWKVVSEESKGTGRLLTVDVSMAIQGNDKPALVAEWLLYIS
jgi:acyl dehydratase|tara:strand:+ start:6167 stop:6583 length:417 start_codon:yes stop_codon:yes gene_type:complete